MTEFMDIDGSVLEGGGQILRISISLSAILGVPVRVRNIRAGRKKPGLAAQHLKGIQLVADMCGAETKGLEFGSTEIEFSPGKIRGGHYCADIPTAGSTSLLIQVALPVALMADCPVFLDLKGGTNADMAPQIDYLIHVFKPLLKRFGGDFMIDIKRRGYFPKGGGHVVVQVRPVRKFHPTTALDTGSARVLHGVSFVAGVLPLKMAQEMASGAIAEMSMNDVNIRSYKEDRAVAPDNCSGIVLWTETSTGLVVGGAGLGRAGAAAREVGARAAAHLRRALDRGACVDDHGQDQMILYMALAEGTTFFKVGEITLHTKTAIFVAEKIAKVKFIIDELPLHNVIECKGIGHHNTNLPPQ